MHHFGNWIALTQQQEDRLASLVLHPPPTQKQNGNIHSLSIYAAAEAVQQQQPQGSLQQHPPCSAAASQQRDSAC
jgi:hypothetical protein